MDFIRNEETKNLNALLKALKKGDKAESERLRNLTGVKDDYETIKATVRFIEIGAAMTYSDAAKIHEGEEAMKKETDAALEKAKWWRDFVEKDKKRTYSEGASSWDLADAQRDHEKSEEQLRSAEDYRSIWKD